MGERKPNIAFAGLTAAGKTTHAKILAEQLSYEYVSATEIILDILNMADDPDRVWLSNYEKIERVREGDRVDIELESRLRSLADSGGGLVLDTWAMAHIYEGPLVRIWLESDKESRTRKCYVSQGEQKARDLVGCRELIIQKDNDTRKKFLSRLGFDLFTDKSRYDAVVCNTDLIPEPTESTSIEGIRTFSPVVYDVASYLVDQALGDDNPLSLDNLYSKYGSMIQRLNENPWSF